MRQRNIEHQCLQNLALLRKFRKHLQISHDLQPVRDFQDGHARVGRILDNEFLIVLRFQSRILGLDRGDLVQSVHHLVDFLREIGCLYIIIRVFPQRFMKKNCGCTFCGKTYFIGNNERDIHRVLHERMPVISQIIFQRIRCNGPGTSYQCPAFLIVMGEFLINQIHITHNFGGKSVFRVKSVFKVNKNHTLFTAQFEENFMIVIFAPC